MFKMSFPIPSASVPIVHPQAPLHSGEANPVLSDLGKIRDLAEQIRQRCAHAHLAGQQQSAGYQVSQAEELIKRLKEVTDKLQEAVKDVSLGDVRGKLECVASRLGFKFEVRQSPQSQTCSFFIISDAFYTEVCCQANGRVTAVRLVQAQHQQEDSEVLCQLLCSHDYSQFERHLQVLKDLYKQSNSATDYSNIYRVLAAIEQQVVHICDKSPPQSTVSKMIMCNPLGHVTPRKGGLPQYLTIFIHPYEVLQNPSLSKPSNTTVGGVASSRQEVDLNLGVAVKMMIEKSFKLNRLSVTPNLFDFSTVHFYELTEQNSILASLNFTLELSKPLPTCGLVLDRLHDEIRKGGNEQRVVPTGRHINQLVAQTKANKEGQDNFSEKTRLVCLPGQRQYYFMPAELKSGDVSRDSAYPASICGTVLNKVSFYHPVHLFSIIPLLRKQLMYNTLLDSCLGRSPVGIPPTTKESEFIFELSTMPPDQIVVSMDTQTAGTDRRIIVEFIVPDQEPTKVVVQVKVGTNGAPFNQPQLSEITRSCLSIPVALHSALKHPGRLLGPQCAAALKAYQTEVEDFNRELGAPPSKKGLDIAPSDTEPQFGTYLGIKRKRVD